MIFPRIKDRNILRIYESVLIVGIAYGISVSLTALHLDAIHYSKTAIGTLAAWFASGIVLFSLPMGGLVRRFGARTTLIAALCAYASSVIAFPHFDSYAAIAGIRFVDGAASVGIWVSSETILLSRSDSDHKAYVTSIYAMAMALGYVIGSVAALGIIAVASDWLAFATSGVLSLATALNMALRLDADPPLKDAAAPHAEAPPSSPAISMTRSSVLWRIKTSCFATFAYGYFQATAVVLLPLFLIEEKHIAREKTLLVTAFFAGGMLLSSNVVGRLGDRIGHLRVMRTLAAIGMCMVLAFVFFDSFPLMCVAFFVTGGTLASMSAVSLALQGVVASRAEYHRANAIYNAFYAMGMLIGPPLSSTLYSARGGTTMILHLAGLWGAFVLFTIVFWRDDPAARRRARRVEAALPAE